jgi:hypothetical protein
MLTTAGNDQIVGGGGADILYGQSGNDSMYVSAVLIIVLAAALLLYNLLPICMDHLSAWIRVVRIASQDWLEELHGIPHIVTQLGRLGRR